MTVFTVQPDTLGEWAVEDSYGRHTTEPVCLSFLP
jgi:hypothetical protein